MGTQVVRHRVAIVWFLWFGVMTHLVGGCASTGHVRVQADDHYRLAQSYLSTASYVQAEQEIRKALDYQANLPEAHHNLGLAYTALGRRAEAIRAFHEAIRFRPGYVDAHLGLGNVLLHEGRKDEARVVFERVIALAPGSNIAADLREQLKSFTP